MCVRASREQTHTHTHTPAGQKRARDTDQYRVASYLGTLVGYRDACCHGHLHQRTWTQINESEKSIRTI